MSLSFCKYKAVIRYVRPSLVVSFQYIILPSICTYSSQTCYLSVEYHDVMAVTLHTRAGSNLRANLYYWAPGKTELMPSAGYTARLQLRSAGSQSRLILSTKAVATPDTAPLILIEESHWKLNLSGSITKSLPSVTRFELELVNDDDPDDTIPLVNGAINVTPQAVSRD